MSRVYIDLGSRSYAIHIGQGLLASAGEIIKEIYPCISKVMVVTNPTVNSLYGHKLLNSLEGSGITTMLAEIPDGEESKALSIAGGLYDLAYTGELDRKTPVIALGGGVVGDLAGFVAATYLRGVPFVQIPTTLLAQVDSSVGGKVAVNHPRGKNIIGAFYQPSVVIADLSTLKTLDHREMRGGLSEVIKYGVISDEKFFGWLEENLEKAMEQDTGVMENIVTVSCRIKAGVVQEDETEQGRRAILNFGHTVGHAVESLTGYGVYRHGEAVAIGMAAAARISEKMGLLDSMERQRLERLLDRAGLPVSVPVSLDRGDLISSMRRDKKVISSRLTFVIPEAMGRVRIVRDLDEQLIVSCL